VFRLLQRHERLIRHGAIRVRGRIRGINDIIEQFDVEIVPLGVDELLRRGLDPDRRNP